MGNALKNERKWNDFARGVSRESRTRLALVRLIVGVEFERPDIRLEGRLAAGQILLREEGSLVGSLLRYIVHAGVDRSGNVISASPGKAGTTTNDPILREAAKAAALKAKFNSDPKAAEVQVGTITYTFIQQ